jgi:hypothetical protein
MKLMMELIGASGGEFRVGSGEAANSREAPVKSKTGCNRERVDQPSLETVEPAPGAWRVRKTLAVRARRA